MQPFHEIPVRCSSADAAYNPTGRLHRHEHHEILIIQKGGGQHIIDYETHPVLDHQIFFLRPGQVHQFIPEKSAKFFFVAIDKESILLKSGIHLNQFEFFQSFNTQSYIQLKNLSDILNTVHVLEKESKKNTQKHNQSVLICGYLMVLLVKIQRAFLSDSATTLTTQSELVSKFNQLIDQHNFSKRFVQNYADELHVSANYLNECVKKETGQPASHWIQEKILIESKRRLKLSGDAIGVIAKALGFKEVTHFTRFFKQQLGTTPIQFRKN